MSEVKEIKEKDKPFILALIASGITILCILFIGAGAFMGNKDMTSNSFEVLKFTFPLTTMAWTFYFKS